MLYSIWENFTNPEFNFGGTVFVLNGAIQLQQNTNIINKIKYKFHGQNGNHCKNYQFTTIRMSDVNKSC